MSVSMSLGDSGCYDLTAFFNRSANMGTYSSDSPNDTRKAFLLFGIPTITGIIGNVFVLILVACSRKIRSKPFLFLISLSASDLLMIMVSGPEQINRRLLLVQNAHFNDFLCRSVSYAELVTLIVLALNLTCVSIERYIAVCHPFHARIWCSRRHCRCVILMTWVVALTISSVEAYLTYGECLEFIQNGKQIQFSTICQTSSENALVVPLIKLIVMFIIPFSIMLFCYSVVIYHLWSSAALHSQSTTPFTNVSACNSHQRHPSRPMQHQQSELTLRRGVGIAVDRQQTTMSLNSSILNRASMTSLFRSVLSRNESSSTVDSSVIQTPTMKRRGPIQANQLKRARKRVVFLLIAVLAVYVICWVPRLVMNVRLGLDNQNKVLPSPSVDQLNMAASCLMLLHSTLNPLMYLLLSKDMRKALTCKCTRSGEPSRPHMILQDLNRSRREQRMSNMRKNNMLIMESTNTSESQSN